MNCYRKIIFSTLLITLSSISLAWSNLSPEVQLANLQEDVGNLQHIVGKMRLEVEAMQQENKSLRLELAKLESKQDNSIESRLTGIKEEITTQTRKQKQEILSLVAIQVERLAKQTQSAIDSLSKSTSKGNKNIMTQFSDDYPKNGIVYVVQSGDTLGVIAQKNNASVKDIQNANRIANPSRDLRAGDSIFIPQKS